MDGVTCFWQAVNNVVTIISVNTLRIK
jgi:hypothetical protein